MSRRAERVAEQIRAETAQVLREEVTDPRIRLVSVNRVEVTKDLGAARIYWNTLEMSEEFDIEAMKAGLESASKFVRSTLAGRLPLRKMPELRFIHDTSVADGARVVALISALNSERENKQGDAAEPPSEGPESGKSEDGEST